MYVVLKVFYTAVQSCNYAKTYLTLLQPLGLVPNHASLSMGFPRQESWSGFLLQEIFLDQGLNPCLLHWQVDSLCLSHQGVTLQVFIANRKLVAYM